MPVSRLPQPSPETPVTLIIGIGNCGRGDDGLGWAFLDRLQADGRYAGGLEYRYQLQIEDAERISRERGVLFVDAGIGPLPGGLQWRRCMPTGTNDFTSHALAPGVVLQLCQRYYGRSPRAELLVIEGREWELGAGLSVVAERNLAAALDCFETFLPPWEKTAA
jgi:hydrogenase maturation protease